MRAVVALVSALSIAAQEPGFEVQSRLVLVPVTVTDSKGRPVEDLTADQFTVLDNGRPQKITVDTFATGVAPIALVIAVQSAGISAPVLDKVRKIGNMIQPLITGQRGCAGLLAFDERVTWLQECTRDGDALSRAFSKLAPAGHISARMLDAVNESVKKLAQRPNSRRVLLLISESRDRGSETELQPAAVAAQAAGVTVYAASYSAYATAFTTKPKQPEEKREVERRPRTPPSVIAPEMPSSSQGLDIIGAIAELVRLGKTNDIQALATATGGATLSFLRQKGLEDAIERLGAELHTQYVLSFVPDSPSPGQHRIEVRISDQGKLQVRARPAYWAGE